MAPAAVFTTIADATAHGQRIDRYLADAIGTLSRSRVKSLIEQGHVRRNGAPLDEPAEAVRTGTTYTLDLPAPSPATPQPQSIPFTILYEDADLIVLDKPAGLVVHPAPGNEDGTLVNALLAHCGDSFTGIGDERRPGIVHRLDKDTSGVMVVAKTQHANTALTAAFAARDLDRAYLALAWGVPNPLEGEIEGAIGRDKRDRKRMAVVDTRRQGSPHPLPHAADLALCRQPAGMPPGHRTNPPDPRPPREPWPPYRRRPGLPAARPRGGPRPAGADPPAPAGLSAPGPARRAAWFRSSAHRSGNWCSPPTRQPTWRNCWPRSTEPCILRSPEVGQIHRQD